MSINAQRTLAIAVAVTLAVIGAIQLANPETLGITPRISAWLGILAVGLGILAGFLPNVRATTKNPEILADRVWELSEHDRQLLISEIERRAAAETVVPHG